MRSGSHAKGNKPSSRLSVCTSGPVNFSVVGSGRSGGVRIFQIEVAACDDLHDSLHHPFQFATNPGPCSILLRASSVCRFSVHRRRKHDSFGRLAGDLVLTYLGMRKRAGLSKRRRMIRNRVLAALALTIASSHSA